MKSGRDWRAVFMLTGDGRAARRFFPIDVLKNRFGRKSQSEVFNGVVELPGDGVTGNCSSRDVAAASSLGAAHTFSGVSACVPRAECTALT